MLKSLIDSAATPVKPLTRQMHQWFLIDTLLVAVAGLQLYVFTEHTNRFFAWTIDPPLTAAFLGAAYWASVPLVFLASRQTSWAHARMAVPGVFLFTTLTTIATFIHLDRFHLSSPEPIARFAAWVWLAIYVSVPPSLLVLLFLQRRLPGGDPPREQLLPSAARAVLIAQAATMLIIGLILFIRPLTPLWPWTLTPLTGRAVAAWLMGIGIIAAHAAWENDWLRVRGTVFGFAILALLQVLALARYPADITWTNPATYLYLFFLLTILAVCIYIFAGHLSRTNAAPTMR
ncbi:MAG: hypothetical protein IPM53_19740 [Anaerolineaceae bacterium]|nr:hypothetical protein [Anaerolineaceae bacterium]